jgi:AraC-like DNA-binding protein
MQDYPGSYLYRRIVTAKLFIDRHYAGRIALDSIADKACFSRFHFIRLFRRAYGCTPHQYLIALRVEKAKGLLEQGRPVSAVCREVGFESISSFTGLFKRATGTTPAAYQKHRQLDAERLAAFPLRFVPHCFAAAAGWAE